MSILEKLLFTREVLRFPLFEYIGTFKRRKEVCLITNRVHANQGVWQGLNASLTRTSSDFNLRNGSAQFVPKEVILEIYHGDNITTKVSPLKTSH